MPDVIEQLRRYGDALENLPLESVAPAAHQRRPARFLLAAACLALIAGAVAVASMRDEPPSLDESALPAPYSGPGASPPEWMAKPWLTVSVQTGFPDGAPTRFDIGDRAELTIETGRIVVRSDCALVAAPVSFSVVPATDIDTAKTAIDVEGSWVHQGCDLPDGLMELLDSRRIVASGDPSYRSMSLLVDESTEIGLAEILHPDPDAQYLLEPLLQQTRELDVIRTIAHLRDALPNDRWDYQGEVITPTHAVAIGRVGAVDVVERDEIADMGLTDSRFLRIHFDVEQSWGEPLEPTVMVGLVTRGADADRMANGLRELGTIVLFLDSDSPVYDFERNLYAIDDNGARIVLIGNDSALDLPAYDHQLADPYLEGIETLDQLIAELNEPVEDHGYLDPLGGFGANPP